MKNVFFSIDSLELRTPMLNYLIADGDRIRIEVNRPQSLFDYVLIRCANAEIHHLFDNTTSNNDQTATIECSFPVDTSFLNVTLETHKHGFPFVTESVIRESKTKQNNDK